MSSSCILPNDCIPLTEVANWTELPGSKLNVVGATVTISKDLLLIRLNYMLGMWPVLVPKQLRAELPSHACYCYCHSCDGRKQLRTSIC